MKEVLNKTREILKPEILEIVADKGYKSRSDIVIEGIISNVELNMIKNKESNEHLFFRRNFGGILVNKRLDTHTKVLSN